MARIFTLLKFKNRYFKEESENQTYKEIKDGAKFSGLNMWILVFTMFISCIGLNTDSISAVIGAMLISPLMGPIVGFSFGLAINDQLLKQNGIRNWSYMTISSLVASTLFFLISPFDNNTTALNSFTKATIFDILLAFFGGLAGFIGIVKHDGTKVIAGVAVATACMPPLCTAGFGIAHADWSVLLGGLYFYLINCLFIGLATFIGARFLKYHHAFTNSHKIRASAQWLWSTLIVVMLIPGIYLVYRKYKEEKYSNKVSANERIQALENRIKELEVKIQSLAK
jgi:uncharacterized hydrophobic protein (TIGR00271 family)